MPGSTERLKQIEQNRISLLALRAIKMTNISSSFITNEPRYEKNCLMFSDDKTQTVPGPGLVDVLSFRDLLLRGVLDCILFTAWLSALFSVFSKLIIENLVFLRVYSIVVKMACSPFDSWDISFGLLVDVP